MNRVGAIVCLAVLACGIDSAAAQRQFTTGEYQFRLEGIVHAQFAAGSAEGDRATDWNIRRARLDFRATAWDRVSGRFQPEFKNGSPELKDAWLRFDAARALRVSVGRFKRAFDIFELNSSSEMVVVERAGRTLYDEHKCPRSKYYCSLSGFAAGLEYSARGDGIKLDGDVTSRLSYMVTLTDGAGLDWSDGTAGSSAAIRVSAELAPKVALAFNASRRGFVLDDDSHGHAAAWGADLDIGAFRDGTHFQAALIGGGNWRLAENAGDEVPRFLSAQAVLSHYVPLQSEWLAAVEPMARASWGDPRRGGGAGGAFLGTVGAFFYVTSKNRLGANLDIYRTPLRDIGSAFTLQANVHY